MKKTAGRKDSKWPKHVSRVQSGYTGSYVYRAKIPSEDHTSLLQFLLIELTPEGVNQSPPPLCQENFIHIFQIQNTESPLPVTPGNKNPICKVIRSSFCTWTGPKKFLRMQSFLMINWRHSFETLQLETPFLKLCQVWVHKIEFFLSLIL